MDADDIAHPERLTRQRDHLLAHPELSLLGSAVRAFSAHGAVGEGLCRYVAWQNGIVSAAEHALARFIESPLCHPSIMARRAPLLALGGYRAFDGPEDYELFLRALAAGHQLAKLPEVLLHWRHRAGRATFTDRRYTIDAFRRTKAPYLAELLRASRRELVMWEPAPRASGSRVR